MSENLQERLNGQLNLEYESSYLYLSMSAYCESISLAGFAKWFRVQSEEELEHAMKFFDHINERQLRVTLAPISQPQTQFSSVVDLFRLSVAHEKKVSASIHRIYASAVSEGDFPTQVFLNWFVSEQVEEEATAQPWLDRLLMTGDSKGTLLNLDKEAGKRAAE